MVFGNSGLMNQSFEKVLAKAGRMRNRQADIFVQVKHFDAPPIDSMQGGQSLEKFELRRARRSNNSRPAVILNSVAERNGCLLRRGPAQRELVLAYLNDHRRSPAS